MKKLFLKMKTIEVKKALLFLTVYLSCIGISFGQSIFSNPITHSTPYNFNPYTSGQSVDANITVSGIGRGPGIGGNAGSGRYNARSWAGSFDTNDYFYFTITPEPGYEIDFVSFSYNGQKSGTGPGNHAFRSSIDSYTANIGSPTTGGTTISLAAPEYQNVQGAITFRFYAWGASSSAGTFSINNFTFNGTVTAIPADTCNLSDAGIADIMCNDNSTGCNEADDYITFSLNPTGTELGTNYTVSVDNGTVSPTTAAYGSPTTFTLQNGSAGGGNVALTITDADDATCELIENITDPGSCAATNICLDDDFNSGYGNWSGGAGTYQNSTAGVTGNGVGFNSTGDNIITSTTITDPQEMSFWLARSSSTANRTLSVQYAASAGGPWTTVRNITQGQVSTTHQLFTTGLNLSGEYYLRIALTQRSGGSFYLDNVSVSCAMSTPLPIAGAEQSFCGNDATVADLDAEGENLQWYNVATGGTPLAPTSILISESNYYVSQTVDGCESDRAEVAITINPLPDTPIAQNQMFCGTATVADLEAETETTVFEGFAGATTLNTELSPEETFPSGTWNFEALNLIHPDEGLPGDVNTNCLAFMNTTPTAAISPEFNGLNSVSFYAYTYYGWESSLQVIKVVDGVETLVQEITLGSDVYGFDVSKYELYEVPINDNSNNIRIKFYGPEGFVVWDNITFNTPGGTINWYDVETGGTPLTDTEELETGSYWVSQTINDCESERVEINVTVNEIPDAPVAENQAFCGEATVADLLPQTIYSFDTIFEDNFNNLSNWNAVNITGSQVWEAASNGSVPHSPYAYMNGYDGGNFENEDWLVSMPIAIPSTTIGATFNFITASNFSGADIEVFYATEYSGGDPNIDGNWTALNPTLSTGGWSWVNSGDLDVSAAIGGNLYIAFKYTSTTSNGKAWEIDNLEVVIENANPAWYDVATGGTPLTSDVLLSTGTYYVAQIENGCESERTEVEVTVNEIPDAPLAENQDFCGEATVADLIADGENIQWYDIALGGTPLESTTALTTTSYYTSQTVNDCESERVEVVVTIKPIPDAPLAENQAFCGDATVADLIADGENIQWYDAETGGTPLADTNVLVTGIYYASQTVDDCESTRTEIEVTAEDLIEPTAQCIADITIQLDSDGQASIDVEAIDNGSFDNCGVDTITLSQTEFDCSHIGDNEVTLTITDNNGNVSTCTTMVTVEENIAPIANCVDVTLELDANGEAVLTPEIVGGESTDNCSIEVTAVDIEYFDCVDIGNPVSVTYFVMDGSGNISSCTALVSVEDALAPEIECPVEPIEIELNPDTAPYTIPNFYEDDIINITDNCNTNITVTQDPLPGTVLGEGTYTISLTATDTSGNESICSFEVVVDDGLNRPEFELQTLTMYPNPASGSVTISNPNGLEIDAVSIYDITGKRLQQFGSNTFENVTMDVSELPSAVYMVHIITNNGQQVYKQLVKE